MRRRKNVVLSRIRLGHRPCLITGVGGGGLGLVVRGATNPVFGLAICGRTISPTGLTIPPNGGIVNTTGDMVLTIPSYFVGSN